MSRITRPFKWFYHEFGIDSIHKTGRNAYLMIFARACRMFAYGTNSLILGMLKERRTEEGASGKWRESITAPPKTPLLLLK